MIVADVQHKVITDKELRKILGIPENKPVKIKCVSVTDIHPDKKLIKWVEIDG